jgi:hypothetical protein
MDAKGSKVVDRSKLAGKGDAAEREKDRPARGLGTAAATATVTATGGVGKNPKKRRKVNHGTHNLLENSLFPPPLSCSLTSLAGTTHPGEEGMASGTMAAGCCLSSALPRSLLHLFYPPQQTPPLLLPLVLLGFFTVYLLLAGDLGTAGVERVQKKVCRWTNE